MERGKIGQGEVGRGQVGICEVGQDEIRKGDVGRMEVESGQVEQVAVGTREEGREDLGQGTSRRRRYTQRSFPAHDNGLAADTRVEGVLDKEKVVAEEEEASATRMRRFQAKKRYLRANQHRVRRVDSGLLKRTVLEEEDEEEEEEEEVEEEDKEGVEGESTIVEILRDGNKEEVILKTVF